MIYKGTNQQLANMGFKNVNDKYYIFSYSYSELIVAYNNKISIGNTRGGFKYIHDMVMKKLIEMDRKGLIV